MPQASAQAVVEADAPLNSIAAPTRPVPTGAQAQLGFPDSLDGSTDDVTTVPFAFRGQIYEVDLSRVHREQLQAALAPFIAAARATTRS